MRSANTSILSSEKKSAKWLRPIVTFGLILDQDSLGNLEDMRKFSEEIGLESQHTMTLLFLPKRLKPQGVEGITLLTPSDISWLGKFKSKEVKDFISQSFDMLLCYQKRPNKVLEKLVESSKAEFKVGRLEGNARIYDLAIAARHEDVKVFIEEVKKYLRILNKLD